MRPAGGNRTGAPVPIPLARSAPRLRPIDTHADRRSVGARWIVSTATFGARSDCRRTTPRQPVALSPLGKQAGNQPETKSPSTALRTSADHCVLRGGITSLRFCALAGRATVRFQIPQLGDACLTTDLGVLAIAGDRSGDGLCAVGPTTGNRPWAPVLYCTHDWRPDAGPVRAQAPHWKSLSTRNPVCLRVRAFCASCPVILALTRTAEVNQKPSIQIP